VLIEVRDIAHDQVATAIDDVADPGDDLVEAIHDCRKRCKKLRGLIRLVRHSIGNDRYHAVNDRARDAARALSTLRDASALHATYARLMAVTAPPGGDRAEVVELVEGILRSRRHAVEAELGPAHSAVGRARALLDEVRTPIDDAADALGDDWDQLGPGLATTYGRARSALAAAIDEPTGERFHEWRKRVKYAWYHTRLVEPSAPALIAPRMRLLHDLSDALGDAHDLVVLRAWLHSDDPVVERLPDRTPVLTLAEHAAATLEERAVGLGRIVFAESPGRHASRLGEYWSAWRDHGIPGRVGELEVVLAG
jgi:CHAD domain-containing protein